MSVRKQEKARKSAAVPGKSAREKRGTAGATAAVVVQGWIEPISTDLEAVSAFEVVRQRLDHGGRLGAMRRMRLIELSGALPSPEGVGELLHRSTQFYNPHKERCQVRGTAGRAAPVPEGAVALLVVERGGARRPAAERWWLHETGEAITVREGVVWVLEPAAGAEIDALAEDLAILRDPRHGLLCNPNSQQCRRGAGAIPLPWMDGLEGEEAVPERKPGRRVT